MTLHIEAAGITHKGTVRDNNEDCIAIGYWTSQETMETARPFHHALDLPFACVVADGMGGHNDGEKASLLVAKSLARRLPAIGPDKIAASVRAVNAELYAHVGEHPELAGMGSTVVGLAVHGASLAIFNVGDSRAYKIVGGGLKQLSIDDSFVQNWKPGSGVARTTMLTQCFGGRPTFTDIHPHMLVEPAVTGSTYLICCDGLYETLPEEQMVKLIGADLKSSAEALLRAALELKAKDNVTIALVRVTDKAPA
ncbi:MAG: PP2C family serine/threonine-protein phosphatase [Betaproteobacteria bacterium]